MTQKIIYLTPSQYQEVLEIEYHKRNFLSRSLYTIEDIKKEMKRCHIRMKRVREVSIRSGPFTPIDFTEYIGQEKAKLILNNYIQATTERKAVFPHCLIHGKAGFGKTTLAKILIKTLKKEGVEVVASSLEPGEIQTKLGDLQSRILFIDEIHSLTRDQVEQLYQAMETFTMNGQPLEPFTLIGATTELGEIIKDRKPFYDRFKIILELEDYTIPELMKIGKQFQEQSFPKDVLETKIIEQIATNSRFTPRAIIRLTEATVYFKGNLATVLSNFGILYQGYTDKDLKILQYLSKTNVVGLQGIASYLDTSVQNYLYEIEPYLIKSEVLFRTPRGRAISDKGRKLLPLLAKRKATWNDTQKKHSTSWGTSSQKSTTGSITTSSNS